MKIEDVQKRKRRSIICSVRITDEESKFMKEKNISPSAVLKKSLSELMK